MKDDKLLAALEEVAGSLGIKVRHEQIKKNTARQPKGGLCYVHGEPRIILHKPLPTHEKVQVLIEALQSLDLENVYIAPEVRQAIEGAQPLLNTAKD
jgi:hypothetical protein